MSKRKPTMVAKGLTKSYRIGAETLDVLAGIDLSIYPNEIVAIRGQSGAGKSTLLHLLGLLDQPDAGEILINGVDVLRLNRREQARHRARHLGFVFQFYHLLPDLTALENVCLANMVLCSARTYKHKQVEARALELLDQVGLSGRLSHKPAQLSGGERQRVAIARALLNEPQFVLCDEPTGNLDPRTAKEALELLWQLKGATQATFVVVTHDEQVAKKADRVVQLVGGRIVPKAGKG